MSWDPVALDRLLVDLINQERRENGFDELPSPNLQLSYASKIGLGEDSIDSIVIKNINEEQWFVSWEMGNHALFSYSSWNFCLKAFFLRYGIEWLLSDFSTDKLSI